jgi:hypothetical protein
MSRRPRLSEDDAVLRSQHSQVPQAKKWSESPAMTRLSTVRTVRQVTTLPTPQPLPDCYYLRPSSITYFDTDHRPDYVGGGGQSTLSDSSESTYMRIQVNRDGGGNKTYWPCVATFGAVDLASGFTIDSATLTARVLKEDSANVWMNWECAEDITGGNTFSPNYGGGTFNPLNDMWGDYTVNLTSLPSASAVQSGVIQVLFEAGINIDTGDHYIDVSELTLTICRAGEFLPLFWWKMDIGPSGDYWMSYSEGANTNLGITTSYGVGERPPLAPGSIGSIELMREDFGGCATTGDPLMLRGLLAGDIDPSGTQGVAFDLWVDGLQSSGAAMTQTVFEFKDISDYDWATITSVSNGLTFWLNDSNGSGGMSWSMSNVDDSVPDGVGVHIRWEFLQADNSTNIIINGSVVHSETLSAFPFQGGSMFGLKMCGADDGTWFDDIKIYGGLSSIG